MFDILLKKADIQNETLKGMKFDISTVNQKIKFHFIAMKQWSNSVLRC